MLIDHYIAIVEDFKFHAPTTDVLETITKRLTVASRGGKAIVEMIDDTTLEAEIIEVSGATCTVTLGCNGTYAVVSA